MKHLYNTRHSYRFINRIYMQMPAYDITKLVRIMRTRFSSVVINNTQLERYL